MMFSMMPILASPPCPGKSGRRSRPLPGLLLAALVALSPLSAEAYETKAPYAYLMDAETGAILLDKNGDQPMPPASMSKLMTVFLLMEDIQSGRVGLDSQFSVSENAWAKGGASSGSSTMFLHPHSQVRVEDLLRGIIVQSGNDACIVVAENLAGSEMDFAARMTARARELGLKDSHFVNATGWPDPEQMMSARDLAVLSREIVTRFPQFYEVFGEKEFTYNGIKQGNRNPLLYKFPGADGLKTGHTQDSGYGLTASAKLNGRRLILVLNGLASMKDRSAESERLLTWGFHEFDNYRLFKKGDKVETAQVWLGSRPSVDLLAPQDYVITLPRAARRDLKVTVVLDEPVPAPIAAGQKIAVLRIAAPGMETTEKPLLAAGAVDRLGFVGRIGAAARYLFWGYSK